MRELATTLLMHTTAQGSHFDWLLGRPDDALQNGRLWTARVAYASDQWASMRSWVLQPLATHRRDYLQYQGPVSGGRGTVTRVDQGVFTARLWTADRIVIDLSFARAVGCVELSRLSDDLWRAAWRQ